MYAVLDNGLLSRIFFHIMNNSKATALFLYQVPLRLDCYQIWVEKKGYNNYDFIFALHFYIGA